jgi:hypothetical protein
MKITTSICRVAGERVALVAVQKSVVEHQVEADRCIEHLGPVFEGLPVLLMGVGESDSVRWYGRSDLVDKMGEIPVDRIPWEEIDVDL